MVTGTELDQGPPSSGLVEDGVGIFSRQEEIFSPEGEVQKYLFGWGGLDIVEIHNGQQGFITRTLRRGFRCQAFSNTSLLVSESPLLCPASVAQWMSVNL